MKRIISAIIIQARTGSTRLKDKVVAPLAGQLSILDIIIIRLTKKFPEIPVVVATTTNDRDDVIAGICRRHGISCFRGDEQDVLRRFIDCCTTNGFDNFAVRVCSDNPFLDTGLLADLMLAADADTDYLSNTVGNVPAMRTHFGFFAEVVKVAALQKAAEMTTDPLYREHVTNFIYTNPDIFRVKFLEVPELAAHPYIRLTIDTKEDFDNAGAILEQLQQGTDTLGYNWKDVLDIVAGNDTLINQMERNIDKNKK